MSSEKHNEVLSLYSWWYNWHVTPNHELSPAEDHCSCSTGSCGPPPANKVFVPMVWGYHEEDRPWHDDITDQVSEQYDVILGFNEPNHEDQANLPPEVAASAWLELQNMYPDRVSASFGIQISIPQNLPESRQKKQKQS